MTPRDLLPWLGLLLLGACSKDYDRFTFVGGTTSSGGGEPGGGGPGGGGQASEHDVLCGAVVCDTGSDGHCCLPEDGADNGTCRTSCLGGEADLGCDGPADCPGEVCCLTFDGAIYESAQCQAACPVGALELCDPALADPCNGGTCDAVGGLPAGFNACGN